MAKETVIIADESKIVEKLGVNFPVPVSNHERTPFNEVARSDWCF